MQHIASLFAAQDSDMEFDLEEDETLDNASFLEAHAPGGDRKRRRLARAKDHGCSGYSILRAAAHRAATTEATLIILDWDDTLLPSTWLQQNQLQIVAESPAPNEEQKAMLRKVARSAIKILLSAKQLGQVTIVTNAEKGWVELSCSKFLPEIFPLLEGIKIFSARSTFEHSQPQNPIHWKRLAFRKEINTFLQASSPSSEVCRKNLISVGDSMSERTALLEATEGRDCWRKSLKFIERPSPEHLMRQQKLLNACLEPLVDFEGSLDLCLQVQDS
jgi:hypothetical protein